MKVKKSYKAHKKWEQWKLDSGERVKMIKEVQLSDEHARDLNIQKNNTNIEYVEVVAKKPKKVKEETKTEE